VNGAEITIFGAHVWQFHAQDPLERDEGAAQAGNAILAPMPGLLKAVFAKAGQAVLAGQRLAILEAMKMEHALAAPRDGVVAEVLLPQGTQVDSGAPLILLAEEDSA